MAGSRLEKLGTIFSRVSGLLRSGALKEGDKPIWYDVYKTFPPQHEPYSDRPAVMKTIPQIFYPEDVIRAEFYKTFGSPGLIDMSNEKTNTLSQKFVQVYLELEKEGKVAEEALFSATVDVLAAQGIILDRAPTTSSIQVVPKQEGSPVEMQKASAASSESILTPKDVVI